MEMWILRFAIAIILSTLLVFTRADFITTTKNTCQLETDSGVLNINNPKAPGKLLLGKRLDSKEECKDRCCDDLSCNSYVWHKTGHCFLFNCCSGSQRDVIPNDNAEVGYVYHKKKESAKQDQSGPPGNLIPLKRDSQDDAIENFPGNQSEKQVYRKLGTTTHANHHDADAKGSSQDYTSRSSVSVYNMVNSDSSKREPVAASKSENSANFRSATLQTTLTTRRSTSQHEKASHTTTTSLIAALCFGLMFLLAVLFMIGRRWYENFTGNGKNGYNRVSFLMNGM